VQQAWYRKYRPKTFDEVVGQEHIKTTLLNQVKSERIGHAYLFAGPKGTGKTSLARILARSVNCLGNNPSFAKATEGSVNNDKKGALGEPCGTCNNCSAFENNQMIDLIEIDAASHTGVDNIRELVGQINLAPSLGKYKVYVIDEAHMLSRGAFNALLKTLEEPPSHAIFVLATTEPHKLPATIISRCQRFDFRYLSVRDIADFLKRIAKEEKIKIDDEAVLFLAEQSEGSLRDGISLLEQAASMGSELTKERITRWLGFVDWSTVYELTKLALERDAKQTIDRVNQLYLDGYDLTRLAEAWIKIVRQMLAVKLGNSVNATEDQSRKLMGLTSGLTIAQVIWMLEESMKAASEIKMAALPQIPLELMIVRTVQMLGEKEEDKKDTPDKPIDTPPPAKADDEGPSIPRGDVSTDQKTKAKKADINWPSIVQQVRSLSPTLGAMLGQATASFEDGELILRFKISFYKEAMEQSNNQQLLRQVLKSSGMGCTIKCLVDKSSATTGGGLAVDEVVKVFGEA